MELNHILLYLLIILICYYGYLLYKEKHHTKTQNQQQPQTDIKPQQPVQTVNQQPVQSNSSG